MSAAGEKQKNLHPEEGPRRSCRRASPRALSARPRPLPTDAGRSPRRDDGAGGVGMRCGDRGSGGGRRGGAPEVASVAEDHGLLVRGSAAVLASRGRHLLLRLHGHLLETLRGGWGAKKEKRARRAGLTVSRSGRGCVSNAGGGSKTRELAGSRARGASGTKSRASRGPRDRGGAPGARRRARRPRRGKRETRTTASVRARKKKKGRGSRARDRAHQLELETLGRGIRGVAELEESLEDVLLLLGGLLVHRRRALGRRLGLRLFAFPLLLALALRRSRLLGLARGREALLVLLVLLVREQPLLVELAQGEGLARADVRGDDRPRDVAPPLAAARGVESASARDAVVERLQVQFPPGEHRRARHALALGLHEVRVLRAEPAVLALLQPQLQLVHRLDPRLERERRRVLMERNLPPRGRDDPAKAVRLRLGAYRRHVPNRILELLRRRVEHRSLLHRRHAVLRSHLARAAATSDRAHGPSARRKGKKRGKVEGKKPWCVRNDEKAHTGIPRINNNVD